jgi:putative transposase
MLTNRGAAEGAMARSAEPIVLSELERDELDRLVRAHSTPPQLALRARIILLAADGIGNRETARRRRLTVQTVRCWRRRWNGAPDRALADRLADAPRPGTPPIFTPEQICALPIAVRFATGCRADSGSCGPAQGLALACEPPDASGVPITPWSQSALARDAVKRGLVETISHGSVGRFLKAGGPPAPSCARRADAHP